MSKDYIKDAKAAVVEYFNSRSEITDSFKLTEDQVYIPWASKQLTGWKVLVSTEVPDGMYYELTYNGEKKELYIDAYKKFNNTVYYLEE